MSSIRDWAGKVKGLLSSLGSIFFIFSPALTSYYSIIVFEDIFSSLHYPNSDDGVDGLLG